MLMKRIFFAALLILSVQAVGQEWISETSEEVKRQQQLAAYPVALWDSLRCAWYGECPPKMKTPALLQQDACTLNKRFFGWHAIGTSSSSYQWNLISDLSYFSYQVQPSTGDPINSSQMATWYADATVLAAKANNVRVSLCVTLFNNSTEFATFFGSPAAQANLVSRLVNEASVNGADGINIDFEGSGLTTTYLNAFVSFMSTLHSQLKAAKPAAEISIDLQGSFGSAGTMHTQLLPYVDLFILMGYDYYWGSQKYPGPVGPTYQFPKAASDPFGHGNVANDLNSLLRYVPASKVLLAMPYYGRRWKTTNGCVIPADGDAASPSAPRYFEFRQNSNGDYTNTLRDSYSFNAYHCFNDINGVPYQHFIDDTISLQRKYDVVIQRGLAGVAVWRLGYDAGYADCWNLVNGNLTQCAASPSSYDLYDMGGPLGNYVNNSRYTFSISPSSADYLQFSFQSFDLEQGYDSLWLYNGSDTTAPLLAGLTGALVPGPMVASSGKLTVRFKSDGATTKPGFAMQYAAAQGSLIFRSEKTGNWHDPASWSTGTVPGYLDTVVVSTGHVIQLQANAWAKKLTIETGGELRAGSGYELFIRKD
jgi:spore germination protein YaaH